MNGGRRRRNRRQVGPPCQRRGWRDGRGGRRGRRLLLHVDVELDRCAGRAHLPRRMWVNSFIQPFVSESGIIAHPEGRWSIPKSLLCSGFLDVTADYHAAGLHSWSQPTVPKWLIQCESKKRNHKTKELCIGGIPPEQQTLLLAKDIFIDAFNQKC